MKKTLAATLICLFSSIPAFAMHESTGNAMNTWLASRLYMGAYGGYGAVNGAYNNDGNVTQGRLSLGLNAGEYKSILFGAEVAVQSGNDMRLSASPAIIAALGGLPIQSTLKPFIDLLLTVKGQITQKYPLFAIVKGGIAYRQLQLNDRSSSHDSLQKVNGEFQAGLGYKLTEHAMLTAFYQGIYSDNNAGVTTDAAADNTFISNIPTQQAGFIGIEYIV